MATCSFGKQFILPRDKAKDFEKEMTKTVAPTLRRDFQSQFVYLSQDEDLKNKLAKALSK